MGQDLGRGCRIKINKDNPSPLMGEGWGEGKRNIPPEFSTFFDADDFKY